MVDTEKLISLVYERKPLWDNSNRNYHKRGISKKLWNEISVELGRSSHILKTKWQGLRDSFRKEYIKQKKSKSTSFWRYFQPLEFLTDVFAQGRKKGIVLRHKEDIITNEDVDLCDDQVTTASSNTPADSDTDDSSAVSKTESTNKYSLNSHIKQKRDAISQLVSIEERKLQHLQQLHKQKKRTCIHEDQDYHFMMSLLPHLQDIPKRRKLAVRLRLQQVLMEEEAEELVCTEMSSRTSNGAISPPSYEMEYANKCRLEN